MKRIMIILIMCFLFIMVHCLNTINIGTPTAQTLLYLSTRYGIPYHPPTIAPVAPSDCNLLNAKIVNRTLSKSCSGES